MEKKALEQLIPTLNAKQQELLCQAEGHKAEVAKKSLDTLKKVLDAPSNHPYRNYVADVLLMLAHLEEKATMPLLIKMMSLPDTLVEDLLGMTLPKHLSAILYKVSDSSFKGLKAIIQNPDTYLYCRTAAMKAMIYAVNDGFISSGEARKFFSKLYTGQEARTVDSGFWDDLTDHLLALTPTEKQLKVVREAVKRGLTAPQYIDQSYVPMLGNISYGYGSATANLG